MAENKNYEELPNELNTNNFTIDIDIYDLNESQTQNIIEYLRFLKKNLGYNLEKNINFKW